MKVRVNSEAEIIPYLESPSDFDVYMKARKNPTQKSGYLLTGMIGSSGNNFNGPEQAFDLKHKLLITTKHLRGPLAQIHERSLIRYNSVISEDGATAIGHVALDAWNIRYKQRSEHPSTEVYFTLDVPPEGWVDPRQLASQGIWRLMSGQIEEHQSNDLRDAAKKQRKLGSPEETRKKVHQKFKATLK